MRKALSWFFLAALLLAGCSSVQLSTPTATAVPSPIAPQPTAVTQVCTVEASLPPAEPDESSRFAPVTEADWVRGPLDASITILEYSDYM